MKLKILATILVIETAFIGFLLFKGKVEPLTNPRPITHAQDTWERALEWCESRGLLEAVNPEDLDGTPSYYSWQWKPETFLTYALRYKVIDDSTTIGKAKELMKNYELQQKTLDGMIGDKNVKWESEFPNCVKKLGRPPQY